MSCDCKKNQTHPEVLKQTIHSIGSNDISKAVGVGMFVIPAPEKGILESKVVLVDNLSYVECAKRGENCLMFQWINHGFRWTAENDDGSKKEIVVSGVEDLRLFISGCLKQNNGCQGLNFCPPGCWCGSLYTCYQD